MPDRDRKTISAGQRDRGVIDEILMTVLWFWAIGWLIWSVMNWGGPEMLWRAAAVVVAHYLSRWFDRIYLPGKRWGY